MNSKHNQHHLQLCTKLMLLCSFSPQNYITGKTCTRVIDCFTPTTSFISCENLCLSWRKTYACLLLCLQLFSSKIFASTSWTMGALTWVLQSLCNVFCHGRQKGLRVYEKMNNTSLAWVKNYSSCHKNQCHGSNLHQAKGCLFTKRNYWTYFCTSFFYVQHILMMYECHTKRKDKKNTSQKIKKGQKTCKKARIEEKQRTDKYCSGATIRCKKKIVHIVATLI